MQIVYSKRYVKRLNKLPLKLREKVRLVSEVFYNDPFNPSLHNHKLQGVMQGKGAISVTGDFRIIFEECDNYAMVIFLDVGKHSSIYK